MEEQNEMIDNLTENIKEIKTSSNILRELL
jgi:hypothetical protein